MVWKDRTVRLIIWQGWKTPFLIFLLPLSGLWKRTRKPWCNICSPVKCRPFEDCDRWKQFRLKNYASVRGFENVGRKTRSLSRFRRFPPSPGRKWRFFGPLCCIKELFRSTWSLNTLFAVRCTNPYKRMSDLTKKQQQVSVSSSLSSYSSFPVHVPNSRCTSSLPF